MTVLAAHRWASNAELIADVAKLGYLDGRVLDLTYGEGTFWKILKPQYFIGCDIVEELSPVGYSVDFLRPPLGWFRSFDTVVFDPPYKLNGTPDPSIDKRYGAHRPATLRRRLATIRLGAYQATKMVAGRGHLLVKCQDQVASGRMWWQTDMVAKTVVRRGFTKVDRLDLLGKHRPQPMEGRRQKHAHGRPSTLLVFRRD